MPCTPELKTVRLLLRPLRLSDAEPIQDLFPHWEVVRYLNAQVPWPYPADGALHYLRDACLPAMAAGREWHWSIRLLDRPEQLIGSISLMDQPDNHRGFWVAPAWQGQGYITEACEVIDAFWFLTLRREVMRVPKALPNEASRRVSQRGGMQLLRTGYGDFVSGRLPQEIWEITRQQWLDRQSARQDAAAHPR
ncbi:MULTISPECIES: GNAT family N-acetyltransferase [unclassified Pseudomonas]|uniref:GNAT family N-acetyltransferase n=1 Tax=unclassified Pseudomonas TaxID=196821 RepID=UPI00244855A1|nr:MULTISPECIES: GNAT family N-acetyltransferase [unclassified Pseudomonas]MDH0304344.1 GNAT family N-acetyltransferase [Pseudomonas sp. GD04091]MDH1983253.1 GNAT family N-acetyltransferase [Pseudomonas sp. GD03689]